MAHVSLSLLEREEISRALVEDPRVRWSTIAERLGRHPTTIAREVTGNEGRDCYRAVSAHARAARQRQRPKVCRFDADRALRDRVTLELRRGFSPAGIAARLAHEGATRVCHETIYRAVYARRLDVTARECLRSRRPRRRPRRDHATKTHVLGDFVSIHERPAAVTEHVEAGHWEGDLIIGAGNRSAMITLAERVTRYTLLADLPCGYDADEVLAGLFEVFDAVPSHLRLTLTWDRGSEMARWPTLTNTLELPVYFADPHAPWQRGLNEHTNRQLRWWLPRGTDLSIVGPPRITEILDVLNHQPRRSLDWDTPAHRYHALTVR